MQVSGVGCQVSEINGFQVSVFRCQGIQHGAWSKGHGVKESEFKVQRSGFKVQTKALRVTRFGLRVSATVVFLKNPKSAIRN